MHFPFFLTLFQKYEQDIYRIALEVHHTIQENVKFVYDDAIKLWRVQLTDNSGNYISEIGAINFDPNEM